ncbi:MAG: BlaI/MecI/CopY family transcriptional regulator [Bacteroidales bacterium]|nr:BlaI/MecI/CopY family transcriptional regulator [Bacteroidales bacterium]MBN2819162.1 BlaI/MecI/CopY family transcriptional regulator [Bacteroidales bacterium]
MVTLTKAEEKIMQILWDLKKGFINDILEYYEEPKPPYNSVSTIVRVLVKKEIVGYKQYGGSHQYFPLISKDEYSKGQLSKLVKDYFSNSFKQVASFFSESDKLKSSEVDEVIKMLEEIKQKKNG